MTPQKLLILGGTGEATALARAAIARFGEAVEVTTALTPGTRSPGAIPGLVRIGGFAGVAGLAAYLVDQGFDRMVDASHPFAAEISASARLACDQSGVKRLTLLPPRSGRHPLDRWIEVESMEAAARVVSRVGRRAWLTVGAGAIAAFSDATNVRFLVRLADPPREKLPLRFYEIVLGRGPFSLVEEQHLIERHAIDVLVCKASGDSATEAKLIAARELSLPVVMVRRPRPEAGLVVETIEAVLDWVAGNDPPMQARRMP